MEYLKEWWDEFSLNNLHGFINYAKGVSLNDLPLAFWLGIIVLLILAFLMVEIKSTFVRTVLFLLLLGTGVYNVIIFLFH